jgi:hypothetical protein
MKRSARMLVAAILALFLLAALYLFSPLSKRTKTLQILVERQGRGYQALVVNSGYIPVFVVRCETVNDVMKRDVTVGDAIEKDSADRRFHACLLLTSFRCGSESSLQQPVRARRVCSMRKGRYGYICCRTRSM